MTTRGRLIESNIASDTAKSELSQDENKVDKSLLTKSGQKSKTTSFETVYKVSRRRRGAPTERMCTGDANPDPSRKQSCCFPSSSARPQHKTGGPGEQGRWVEEISCSRLTCPAEHSQRFRNRCWSPAGVWFAVYGEVMLQLDLGS